MRDLRMTRDALRCVVTSLALASCAASQAPPPIVLGTPCAACGMAIQEARFACERQVAGRWRVYDSIECLVRDPAEGRIAMTDYDQRALWPAESLWVVRGDFPSPMGGGLAAFRERPAAEEVAARTRGEVLRLDDLSSLSRGATR